MNNISILLRTFNEEKNIRDCLESIKWADEIIIVDSYSNDKTVEICKEYTQNIFFRKYKCSSDQTNWAIKKASRDWVFIVDADVRISEDLKNEILKEVNINKKYNGYNFKVLNHFLGKTIMHCGWFPNYHILLFRKESGVYEDKAVHARLILNGSCKKLSNPLIHLSFPTIYSYIKKLNIYTDRESIDLLSQKKTMKISYLISKPLKTFLSMYIINKGFLDGTHGFLLSVFAFYYTFCTYAKYWESIQKSKEN